MLNAFYGITGGYSTGGMSPSWVPTFSTLQFTTPPDRSSGETADLVQVSGRDTDGIQYVYDKGNLTRIIHPLVFPHEPDTNLAMLKTILRRTTTTGPYNITEYLGSDGSWNTFTWYDHTGVSHTVRYVANSLKYRQIGPNRNRIEISLEEDVVWTSPAPKTSFKAAKNALSGIAPIWILKLGDQYLSDAAVAISYDRTVGGSVLYVPGDYDGDGIMDYAEFNTATGAWTITPSSTGVPYTVNYGSPGDIPVPADYDGDGKTDLAVWRPSNTTWFVQRSDGGGQFTYPFGISTDKLAPADYNGDGKAEFAVYRPSNGTFYIVNADGTNSRSVPFVAAGSNFTPYPADYNEDGAAELTLFDPATGRWYIDKVAPAGQPGWPAGINLSITAAILSWGKLSEALSGGLNELKISDITVELTAASMLAIVESSELHGMTAELYLWYIGLDPVTAPPALKFRGNVRSVSVPDETRISVTIQNESLKYERTYVGRKLSRVDYPSADPDDVGKVVPIILGTVNKMPVLAVDAGVMTSLPNAITAAATSVIVSDATGLAVGMTMQVDDEQIYISAIAGDTLTVTRGYNTTLAATHAKAAQLWQVKNAFVYMVADHAVDSIPKVFGKVGAALMDITAVCTRYLGTVGNQHANYPGKAIVTIPGYITASQAVSLLVADGIAVNDALSIVDNIAVNDTISVSDTIGLSDPTHGHSYAKSTNYAASNCPRYVADAGPTTRPYYNASECAAHVTFPNVSGTRLVATYKVTIVSHNYVTAQNIRIGVGNSIRVTLTSPFSSSALQVVTAEFSISSDLNDDDLWVLINQTGAGSYIEVQSASRTIELSDGSTVSSSSSVSKTGSASKSGSASKTGNAGRYGSVSKTGTVTLSGNSVANTLVCDSLLVNVVRAFATPLAAMQAVVAAAGSNLSVVQTGTFPASYVLNGAITEYKTLLRWCDDLAWQLRSFFRFDLGSCRLIVRPDTPTSIRTISACRIADDGKKVLSSDKTDYSDIINTINLLFDRDWDKSGDAAYRQTLTVSDATSITNYGKQERPELFKFDFVTDATMAASVIAFYLAYYKYSHWRHSFEEFLDQSDLRFGDQITLAFKGNAVGTIVQAGLSPGSKDAIDTVQLQVEV